jgi:hypothetical protein
MPNQPEMAAMTELDALLRPHGLIRRVYDFFGAPLRMVVLPDAWSNRLGFTSLEDERLRAVLPELNGRVLDIGAGNNRLIRLYGNGEGVEVNDWGGGAQIVEILDACPSRPGASTPGPSSPASTTFPTARRCSKRRGAF